MKRRLLSGFLNLVLFYSTLLAGVHVWGYFHPRSSNCKVPTQKGKQMKKFYTTKARLLMLGLMLSTILATKLRAEPTPTCIYPWYVCIDIGPGSCARCDWWDFWCLMTCKEYTCCYGGPEQP